MKPSAIRRQGAIGSQLSAFGQREAESRQPKAKSQCLVECALLLGMLAVLAIGALLLLRYMAVPAVSSRVTQKLQEAR
jgi:hypothetical protein